MIFYLLWRSAKTCQRDGFPRHQVVGVDGITARSSTANKLARPAYVYRHPSGERNYPEVPLAAAVSVCALLIMPKEIGCPYAPKRCRPSIGALCVTESTSIINPGGKPHAPAVHRFFTVTKGSSPSFGDGNQLA